MKVNIESLHIYHSDISGYHCTAKIGSEERSVEFKLTDAETRALLLPLAEVIASATARFSGLIAADIVAALECDDNARTSANNHAREALAIIEQGKAIAAKEVSK